MNITTELLVRDDQLQAVSWSATAQEAKDEVLGQSALIGRVASPSENEAAVQALTAVRSLLCQAENSRKRIKEHVIAYGRLIDSTAQEFTRELEEEMLRVGKMLGDYQALEEVRVRAAEALRNENLSKIETARALAQSQATTIEESDAIAERFARQAAEECAGTIAPVRAEGQTVRHDWNITVTDVWLLARSHPSCVTIKPRLTEIKALLNAGMRPAGVSAERTTKSIVRATATPITALEASNEGTSVIGQAKSTNL